MFLKRFTTQGVSSENKFIMKLWPVLAFFFLGATHVFSSPANNEVVSNSNQDSGKHLKEDVKDQPRMFYPVIFSVQLRQHMDGDGSGYLKLVFDDAETNEPQGVYDTTAGRFTAPIEGYYHFVCTCSSGHGKGIMLAIQFNQGYIPTYASDRTGLATGQDAGTALNIIKYMQEGDYAEIWWYADFDFGLYGDHCSFSGFKIST